MTITDFVAIAGLVSGVTGTTLGILNYVRDRARLKVTMQWDLESFGTTEYDNEKLWGVINVTNIGRRPMHFSHVAIKLPSGYDASYLLINGGIEGKTLTEGSPTATFPVSQDGMERYSKEWTRIVAQVTDSTGRVWESKRLGRNEKPTWAGGVIKGLDEVET